MTGELIVPTSRVIVSDHCAVLSGTCRRAEMLGISGAPSELTAATTAAVNTRTG